MDFLFECHLDVCVFLGWEDRSGHHPAPEKGAERRAGAKRSLAWETLGKIDWNAGVLPPNFRRVFR
jgi:hypothetical protein